MYLAREFRHRIQSDTAEPPEPLLCTSELEVAFWKPAARPNYRISGRLGVGLRAGAWQDGAVFMTSKVS